LIVTRPITRLIVLGLAMLTLTGIGWALLGRPFTPLLVAKILLVLVLWVLGPYIDKVVEPRFATLAPMGGAAASSELRSIHRKYLALEAVATATFYAITVLGVLI
jgi:hypothetical protein